MKEGLFLILCKIIKESRIYLIVSHLRIFLQRNLSHLFEKFQVSLSKLFYSPLLYLKSCFLTILHWIWAQRSRKICAWNLEILHYCILTFLYRKFLAKNAFSLNMNLKKLKIFNQKLGAYLSFPKTESDLIIFCFLKSSIILIFESILSFDLDVFRISVSGPKPLLDLGTSMVEFLVWAWFSVSKVLFFSFF